MENNRDYKNKFSEVKQRYDKLEKLSYGPYAESDYYRDSYKELKERAKFLEERLHNKNYPELCQMTEAKILMLENLLYKDDNDNGKIYYSQGSNLLKREIIRIEREFSIGESS
jgi:hypothetical protein